MWLRELKRFSILKRSFLENRWGLLIGFMSLVIVDLLQLLIPLLIKSAIDGLTGGTATTRSLISFGFMIILISGFIAIFRYLWRYFLFGYSRKVEEDIRNTLYRHIQTLPTDFFNRINTGDIMARFINDLNAIRMATGMGLVALTDGLIMSLCAIGFMISINLKLTLISLAPAPFVILFSTKITRRISRAYEEVQGRFSTISERIREIFSSIRIIKAYGRERWAGKIIESEGEHYIRDNIEVAKALGLFFPMMALFTNLGLSILIFWGGRLTILNEITTGDFVAFIGYLNLLSWPMMAAGWVVNLIHRGTVSIDRINTILNEKPEVLVHEPESVLHKLIEGNITVQRLSFRYPDRAENALRDVTLDIRGGSSVAIVGRVGSGKSTLLFALMRLIPVPENTIYLDGVDINHIPIRELRKRITMVSQEPIIYSDTIYNNLLLGRGDIDEQKVINALEVSKLLNEVLAFQDGVHTMIGEKGITLSGGQRQRLCLARALIQSPDILLLDDPLSMVDVKTESDIIQAILLNRRDKTTIMVSNRPSTLINVDMIFVMERGTITGAGTHELLMFTNEEYKKLYQEDILIQELDNLD